MNAMILGIVSDTHGRITPLRQALELLRAHGAEAIAHCGDLGGLHVLEELAGWRGWFVWGNTDTPQPSWRPAIEALGFDWPTAPVEFEIDGKWFALFHGHERGFSNALSSDDYDYLLHGHTHEKRDSRKGRMRIINPGALHRAFPRTVALLDVQRDGLQFFNITG
jgi:putative phosphoesterase